MKAYRLQQIDKQNEMHTQAWLYHMAGATKESGKKQVPVFKTYKDFFDYEKQLKEVEKPQSKLTPQMRSMAQIAAKINSGKEVSDG